MTNKDNTMKAIPKVCEILRHKGKKVTKPKLPGLSSPLDAHCKGGPKMYEPSPNKFTPELYQASEDGKLKGNFKKAVDASKKGSALKEKHLKEQEKFISDLNQKDKEFNEAYKASMKKKEQYISAAQRKKEKNSALPKKGCKKKYKK